MITKLTKEQEVVAFKVMRGGGPDAELSKRMFVHLNQSLVGKVASPHRDKGLSWDELLEAGNVGLLKAINKFDPHRGLKFSTCAVPWIKGEITALFHETKRHKLSDRRIQATENGVPLVFDAVVEQNLIEDEVLQKAANKELQSQNEPEEELTAHADLQEAVEADVECKEDGGLGLNATQARSEGYGSIAGCAEWDNLRGEDPSSDASPRHGGLAIHFASDRSTGVMGVDSDIVLALEEAVERLEDPRQKKVMTMLHGLYGTNKHTLKEIGAVLCISLQRVAAIEKAAFAHLREDPTLQLLFEQTI